MQTTEKVGESATQVYLEKSRILTIERRNRPLSVGIVINESDYNRIVGWKCNVQFGPTGYARVRSKSGLPLGELLIGRKLNHIVDHIDRNSLNYQIHNLRHLPRSLNNSNQGLRTDSTTGYKGVRQEYCRLYSATYQINYTRYKVYGFKTAIEAAMKYDELAKTYSLLPNPPTNKSLGLI